MIKENRCVMYPPFEKITELIVSKKFKKHCKTLSISYENCKENRMEVCQN